MINEFFNGCPNKLPCGYCKKLMAPCMNPDYNPPSYDPYCTGQPAFGMSSTPPSGMGFDPASMTYKTISLEGKDGQ